MCAMLLVWNGAAEMQVEMQGGQSWVVLQLLQPVGLSPTVLSFST